MIGKIYDIDKDYKERIIAYTTPEEDKKYFEDIKLHVELGTCIECGCDITKQKFRNKDEEREFQISALCSKCQIKYFGK